MNTNQPGEPPTFIGNSKDLSQFQSLAASPMRSLERGAALQAWSRYKLGRQAALVQCSEAELSGRHGLWTKGY